MKAKLFQIKDIANCDYVFRSFKENLFNFSDYSCVYTSPELNKLPDEDILEKLFAASNMGKLQYNGHSLSVSDIIMLYSGDEEHPISPRYYYCEMCGWKRIDC